MGLNTGKPTHLRPHTTGCVCTRSHQDSCRGAGPNTQVTAIPGFNPSVCNRRSSRRDASGSRVGLDHHPLFLQLYVDTPTTHLSPGPLFSFGTFGLPPGSWGPRPEKREGWRATRSGSTRARTLRICRIQQTRKGL